jgi:hypothetical protein
MNNEPIAFVTGANKFDPVMVDIVLKVGTPLYTHPAKELTNEEISDIRDEFFAPDGCNIYTFAKALLKKAQEND